MSYPSTFVDVQNAVINKLRLDSTNDLSKVRDWINQVYAQVCVETEATQTFATMTLTASSGSYTMPSSVVRIKSMNIKPSGSTQYGPPLRELPLEEIMRKRMFGGDAGVVSGSAIYYALTGLTQLELWPTPAGADTLQMYYVYQPTALSADADVPVLGEPWNSKLLEYGAICEAANYLGNIMSEYENRQLYEAWMQKFRAHVNRRKGGHTGQLVIGDSKVGRPRDNSIDTRDWY